jgi:hypothetical protein
MSDSYDRLVILRGDLDLMFGDLSCVRGTLEEVATMWRRAGRCGPKLPLDLPMRLQDAAGRLACTLRAVADAGMDQPPHLALSAVAQLSALENDIGSAMAMTNGGGIADAGDAGLWGSISQALHRVRERLPASSCTPSGSTTGR